MPELKAIADVKFKGDWSKFQSFLNYSWKNDLIRAVNIATKKGALKILSDIRDRIHKKQYVENRPSTLAGKDGDTPLIDKGTMIKALEIQLGGDGKSFIGKEISVYKVGFLKDQKTSDGRSTLFTVVPILHDGYTFKSESGATFRVPPRPFLKNVFEDGGIHDLINMYWNDAIEKTLKKHGKL